MNVCFYSRGLRKFGIVNICIVRVLSGKIGNMDKKIDILNMFIGWKKYMTESWVGVKTKENMILL